jgi:hypothetical protein
VEIAPGRSFNVLAEFLLRRLLSTRSCSSQGANKEVFKKQKCCYCGRIFLFFKNFFHRALLSMGLVLYPVRYGKFLSVG